jgi:hypothetical protein
MSTYKQGIGHFLAPWPFLIFAFHLVGAGGILCPLLGFTRGIMCAFDLGSAAFLVSCVRLFKYAAAEMKTTAVKTTQIEAVSSSFQPQ